MLIPYEMLDKAVLSALIEDFVTRDGTDNGDETPLNTRVERVSRALQSKQAFIVFDPETEQCMLCRKEDIPKEMLDDF